MDARLKHSGMTDQKILHFPVFSNLYVGHGQNIEYLIASFGSVFLEFQFLSYTNMLEVVDAFSILPD